jgi:hypoxanthine-DNA glycosylase
LTLKRSFPPVVDEHTRLLILGSLPGEVSLAHQQYYAHPFNQFWALVGAVIGVDLRALAYPARLRTLLAHRIGLWDVVAEARREGSLDGNIRGHAPNDLAALVATLPGLRAVAFNGGTSARIGRRQLDGLASPPILVALPSSSPAFTRRFEEKRAEWLRLRSFLDQAPDPAAESFA